MNQKEWIPADNKQFRPPSDENFLVQTKGGDFMVVTPEIIDTPQWVGVLAWQTIQSYEPLDPVKTAEGLLEEQLMACFAVNVRLSQRGAFNLVAKISVLMKAHIKESMQE